VFDSVSPAPDGIPLDARLAFTGWAVRCAEPVFDPTTPVLFDFRTPQAGGSRFVYVLPDDRYRALVELTAFVPRRARPPSAVERRDALAGYLSDVLHAGDFEILRTESAVLPLRTGAPARARTGPRHRCRRRSGQGQHVPPARLHHAGAGPARVSAESPVR
jgi:lycopene beta-cyclase